MEKSDLISSIKALEEKVYKKEITTDNFRELPEPYKEYFGHYLISYKLFCDGKIDKDRLEKLRREILYTNLLSELEEIHHIQKEINNNVILSASDADKLIERAKQEEESIKQMAAFYQGNIKRSQTVPAEVLKQIQKHKNNADFKELFLTMCKLYDAVTGDINETFYKSIRQYLE